MKELAAVWFSLVVGRDFLEIAVEDVDRRVSEFRQWDLVEVGIEFGEDKVLLVASKFPGEVLEECLSLPAFGMACFAVVVEENDILLLVLELLELPA